MTCFHPLIRYEDLRKWTTAKDGHRYHPAIIEPAAANQPEMIAQISKLQCQGFYPELIPCQKCIGCQLEKSRQWANRGYLERKMWEQNWFVTLTYDDDHLPMAEEITTSNDITFTDIDGNWKGILIPKDLELFRKNLRQKLNRNQGETGIRFLYCGEYGGKKDRPHYHLIIFNCNLPKDSFYNPKVIKDEIYWQNYIIEESWGGIRGKNWDFPIDPDSKGKSNISEVTWNNIAYTARYIMKKQNGLYSEEDYAAKGQIKEFFGASTMPGIGKPYFDEHWKEIYERDEIIIKNKKGTISTRPPKYFDDLLQKIDPERMEAIKRKRRIQAKGTAKAKDQLTSLSRLEQLEVEERSKIESTQQLIRIMEMSM